MITPLGVGFVDFGSAVRVNENLKQSPLLSSLFEELMRTSEIQRMMFRMTRTGEVARPTISGGVHRWTRLWIIFIWRCRSLRRTRSGFEGFDPVRQAGPGGGCC